MMPPSLSVALALLTRVPVPAATRDPVVVGRSVLWYPAVGLIVGLVLTGVCLVTQSAPATVSASLGLAAWCLVTGGLHLDGLSDSADALVGGHGDRKRTLAILKDPAAGPMGVAAVAVLLIVKFAALTAHVSAEAWIVIAAAPVVGRLAAVALFAVTPYVRPGGMGEAAAAQLPRRASTAACCARFDWGVASAGEPTGRDFETELREAATDTGAKQPARDEGLNRPGIPGDSISLYADSEARLPTICRHPSCIVVLRAAL